MTGERDQPTQPAILDALRGLIDRTERGEVEVRAMRRSVRVTWDPDRVNAGNDTLWRDVWTLEVEYHETDRTN